MEKYNLIHISGYGDKLNELTSLIYDHVGTFLSKTWGWILALSAVITGFQMLMPESYSEYSLFIIFVMLLILVVVLIVFVSIMKQSFDGEDVERKPVGMLLKGIMPQIGLGLMTLSIIALAIAVVLTYVIVPMLSYTNDPIIEFLFLALCILLFSMCMHPFLQTVNVIVFEGKNGMDALTRSRYLSTCSILKTSLYLFTVSLVGLAFCLLPMLVQAICQTITDALVVQRSYGFTDEPDGVELFVLFVLRCLNVAALLIYMLLLSLASLIEYGNAVERRDNVSFLEKYNNFDNL